jgi:hypothetical protein
MNDNKTETTAPKKQAPPQGVPVVTDAPRGIMVKLMRFTSASFQVPGYSSTDSISARREPDGRTWEIEYIPAMRHHRITYRDPNRNGGETIVGYVHETHVRSWEPVTQ